MHNKTYVGRVALLLFLASGQVQAAALLFAWDYDPAVAVSQWQLLMVRSADQATVQTRVTLVPLSAAQCQQDVPALGLGEYAPGTTWCACLPCPGGAAYTFVLQAVVGEAESGPSNVLMAGLDAACQLTTYEAAVRNAFPASPGEEGILGASGAPTVPVPVEAPTLPTEAVQAELARMQQDGEVLLEHYEEGLKTIAEDYQHGATRQDATARQETLYRTAMNDWHGLMREWEQARQREAFPGMATASPGQADVQRAGCH